MSSRDLARMVADPVAELAIRHQGVLAVEQIVAGVKDVSGGREQAKEDGHRLVCKQLIDNYL